MKKPSGVRLPPFSSVTRDRLPSVEEGVAEFEISYEEARVYCQVYQNIAPGNG